MDYNNFDYLEITKNDTVATVTMNHPPLNMLDSDLVPELKRFVREVAVDDSVSVIVFQSAVPDFFAAHVDASYTANPAGFAELGKDDSGYEGLTPTQHLVASVRALPQVTIAKLRGYLRGGGNEFAMSADLRYAAAGETFMGQIEARMGIIPGGGGTQLLARTVGRSRALEAVLTADLYDTSTAETWGWITRSVPSGDLDSYVDTISRRIASRSLSQIKAAKAAINPTTFGDKLEADLGVEAAALGNVYPSPAAVEERMIAAFNGGLQTPENEKNLEEFLDRY